MRLSLKDFGIHTGAAAELGALAKLGTSPPLSDLAASAFDQRSALDALAASRSFGNLANSKTALAALGTGPSLNDLAGVFDQRSALDALTASRSFGDLANSKTALAALGTSPSLSDLAAGAFSQRSALDAFTAKHAFGDLSSLSKLYNSERGLEASTLLADSASRLLEQQKDWARINRSIESIDHKIHTSRMPNIADSIERALDSVSEKDQQRHDQQLGLLKAIANAGEKQNETMASIAKLQGMLVDEAIENTKIQRTVLYLSGLSAALGLLAIIFK